MNQFQIVTLTVDGSKLRYSLPAGKVCSIFFLGLGQSGKNLAWVAQQAPKGMVVVEALPFMNAAQPLEMQELGVECVREVCKLFTVSDCIVLAESQAAPAVVMAFNQATALPKQFVFLSPLGFSYDCMGKNASARLRKLVANSIRFWSHTDQTLTLAANRETLKVIMSQTVPHPYRTLRALQLAANQNVAKIAEALARKTRVDIFVGTNDQHFPFEAIAQQLVQPTNVVTHELKNERHLNRATKKGITQLQETYDLLQ